MPVMSHAIGLIQSYPSSAAVFHFCTIILVFCHFSYLVTGLPARSQVHLVSMLSHALHFVLVMQDGKIPKTLYISHGLLALSFHALQCLSLDGRRIAIARFK